ncbi:MAG: M56 family metallopeptidase [Planctomycetes bacterium]|nr:M56 family metallopeptidase [Planctomycetota bacterium]
MNNLATTQHRKATVCFTLIVLINFTILSILITGIVLGIKGYISDTRFAYEAVTCCGSICSKCFFTLRTISTILPWACVIILFIGICTAIHKTISMLSWNYRFIRPLTPLSVDTHPKLNKILPPMHLSGQLVLLDNTNLRCAFTSGLWKPKVYLSSGICSYLTRKELLSVILHETHHIKNKDPLKLFVIKMLHALNYFLPINRHLINQYSSASEKAADDSAINFSREPLELASALVKLSKSDSIDKLSTSAAFSKDQNIVEDRIKRILEIQTPPPYFCKTYVYFSCITSLFVAAAICLTLFSRSINHGHTLECKTRTCHMTKCG